MARVKKKFLNLGILDRRAAAALEEAQEASKSGAGDKRTVIAYSVKNSGYQTSGTISGQTGATYSEDYTVTDDASGISLVFGNYYGAVIGDNPINVKVGINVRGVYYPIFFAGKRVVTIEPGGDVESDLLGVTVKKDEIIRVQTQVTVSAVGEKWPLGLSALSYVAGTTDYTMTDIPAGTTGAGYSPIMIRGHVAKGNAKPVVSLWGSSSFTGVGDLPYGFGQRALIGSYSFYRLAGGGEVLTSITYPRLSLAKYSDVALVYVGGNDIYDGVALETVKSNMLSFFNYLHNLGVKVFACTANPRTTSTDNFATVENQTRKGTHYQQGGAWEQLNAWLRPIPYPLHGVYDVATAVESSTGSGKFKPYVSADGTHCNPLGYSMMASVVHGGLEWFERNERMTEPVVYNVPAYGAYDSFNRPDNKYGLNFSDSGQMWIPKTFDGWGIVGGKAKVTLGTVTTEHNVQETNLADCTVESDITLISTAKAGMALRFSKTNQQNGYCWRTDPANGGQIVFSKRNGISISALSTIDTPLVVGQTYKFKTVLQGNSIKVFKDEVLVIDYTIPEADRTFNYLGGTLHGFFINGDTASTFDNFKVY